MTTRLLVNLIFITLMGLAVAGPAMAQTDPDREKLQEAHARNAELLAYAEALVRETNSPKARLALGAAQKLFLHSEDLLANQSFAMASRTIVQTREAILKAINIAKSEAKLEESAHRAIERAGGRLEMARSTLEERGVRDDVPARRLVIDAREQLQRAHNHMRERMFGISLQLANASTDLSQRAIAMLRQDTLTPEDVFRAIERTEQILDRLDNRNNDSAPPHAQRLIAEAFEIQSDAKSNASVGRYRIAFERTRRARQMGLRALKTSSDNRQGADKDAVARAITFTDELLDRASALSVDKEAGFREALADVLATQQKAKEHFTAERYDAARRLTTRARNDVRKLLRRLDRPVDRATVRGALQSTDEVLNRVGAEVSDGAKPLYNRAVARQREAWISFERDELRKALELTRIARNIAREALNRSDNVD